MRTLKVRKNVIQTFWILFSLMLFAGGNVLAAPQYTLSCNTCHEMPPVDSARNFDTGAAVGNHQGHLSAGSAATACMPCHNNSAYAMSHRDGKIQLSPNINASPATGQYKVSGNAITFKNQTSIPILGSCSNVNCHFERATDTWGVPAASTYSAIGANTTTCAKCHDALPSTGSHTPHVSAYGNNLSACANCHPNHAGAAKPFLHATSAGSPINVSGDYSGPSNAYLPSQAASRVLGFCSAASCHDDGLGNGAASLVETPVWGEAVAKCTACHPSRPGTGSHLAHMDSGAVCGNCHHGAVEGTTLSSQHGDSNIDVYKATSGDLGYQSNKPKGSGYVTCSTASCHANPSIIVNSAFKIMSSPVWGVTPSPAKCTICHDSRPATGSHTAHFNAGFALCSNCHKGAVENTTVSTEHVDGNLDVYKTTSNDYGYGLDKTPGTPYSTCSAGSCHEDGRGNSVPSPQWGATNNDCSACHAKRPATGSHSQHVLVGVTCGGCHKGASEGTTAPLQHMDSNVDVYKTNPGDIGYPADKAKASLYTSCSASSCHGTLSPVWGGNTASYQCTKCHGNGVLLENYSTTTNQQAAPGYGGTGVGTGRQTGTIASNVSDDPKVGAHDTHLRGLNNLGKPSLCSDCHKVPATAFIAGHMDGSSLPTWSNLAQNKETVPSSAIPYTFGQGAIIPDYDSVLHKCSTNYCHGATLPGGSDKTPYWNNGTYLTGAASDCGKCHGNPPVTGKSAHGGVNPNDCSGCHPHNGTRASTDPLLGSDFHVNGKLEANKFCDTCHDYDTRGGTGTTWGKNQISVEGYGAHAVHINYLKKRMNVTTMNANLDGFGSANFNGICGVCHSRAEVDHSQSNRLAPRSIIFGDAASRQARQFGPNLPQYNGVVGNSSSITLKTCSNVDCHYKTSPIWQPY